MTRAPHPDVNACCEHGCQSEMRRREFLSAIGIAAATSLVDWRSAVAGPFTAADFEKLVPADKRLSSDWIQSLFARGTPAVYRGEELKWVGMPVGGICAGQLYLGGDGRLWHWDIFNQPIHTGAEHYANPLQPSSPLQQGFALKTAAGNQTQIRALDSRGFSDIAFRGEYPIATIEFRDPESPVSVQLTAYSPFVPLNAADSSLPATVLEYTVHNESSTEVACELAGWLENAVCLHSGPPRLATRVLRPAADLVLLEHTAEDVPAESQPAPRPDVHFEDFESATYEGWTVEGTAFGEGPIEMARMAAYQGDVGGKGSRVVNTHNVRHGEDVARGDAHVGTLTSKSFLIERHYIRFLIGGGGHVGRTCVNLLVEGQVVRSATGANDNRMQSGGFDVRRWAGRQAQLQIVDQERGGWGNIGVDEIVFTDQPIKDELPLAARPDFGGLGLALLGDTTGVQVQEAVGSGSFPECVFAAEGTASGVHHCGALTKAFTLAPQGQRTLRFAIVWHFPNLALPRQLSGRHYATRFHSLPEVAVYLASHLDTLAQQTRLWRDTWYDSTLPYWFLDRTFATVATLATSTCHWLANGRFYGWEGVGCCEGTCTHVWHYAHAVARLFPELERSARSMADFAVAFDSDTGLIGFRGEAHRNAAIDGQAGCILRSYREHQMSADAGFLDRHWPSIRKALEFLIAADGDDDGLIEGRQHNTLDADWYGPVAWLSGLYLAALLAGEQMAREMKDAEFAQRLRAIFTRGRTRIVERLWNGEYFVNRPDPNHRDTINSGTGCHIDQVFGQSWAYQVGLERVFSREHALGALRALWKYNFTPDVGPYRQAMKPGRWYAMAGEGGLIMCTFPRSDWSFEDAQGQGNRNPGFAGYFNECMNGFEYQVAGHMVWEGLLMEGLAITRMIHDRYHPLRRNPWNEVECGDHYARSMAGYGVFLAACGFSYHGPQGQIGFAPQWSADDFRSAFTAAEGWGTFCQKKQADGQAASIIVRWGRLRLQLLSLMALPGANLQRARVTLAGREIPAAFRAADGRIQLEFQEPIIVEATQELEILLTS